MLDPEDKGKQCDLVLNMCDALVEVADLQRVYEVEAPKALSLAEAMGDNRRALRACEYAMFSIALLYYADIPRFVSSDIVQWVERTGRYTEPESTGCVWADLGMAGASFARGKPKEAIALMRHAVDMGRRLDEPEALC